MSTNYIGKFTIYFGGINSIIEFGAQPCLKVLMWTLSNSKIYVLESFPYLQELEGSILE